MPLPCAVSISLQYLLMFAFVSLAAAQGGMMDTARSVGETFGFNSWAFVSQILSFSIVCATLYKFAYHPILKVLEERRQRIELTYREAAALKIQVADAEKRASEIVVQASSGAHKLVEDAKLAALEFQEKQMQQAKAEAEAFIAKARADIKREREVMLAELRSEVASLVVRTTAKVAGKVLTDDDQRRLTEEANRELAA
jgi:F-type H+-transporting ATPase subunit b